MALKLLEPKNKTKISFSLAQGKKDGELYIGAFLLSEPEAGSDATSQHTTAEDKGDHYLVNGLKTGSPMASGICLFGYCTNRCQKEARGINVFIVEKNWPGVTVGAKENKLGIRGSDTHSISFTDVKVPKENRIGERWIRI